MNPQTQPNASASDVPVLLTIKQVMSLTGISRSKIYDYLTSGQLTSVYVGKSRRVRRIDLALFLSSLSDQPDS